MTAAKKSTLVVTIGKSGPTQQQIVAALSSPTTADEFELVEALEPSDQMIPEIRAAGPSIILVDYQLGPESILDVIDEVGEHFPDTAIIAIIPEDDSVIAQQVMLAGARAFLIHPFTQVNLLSVLRRVRDLEGRRTITSHQRRIGVVAEEDLVQNLVVYSPRGGAGCTTIATNLAIALHKKTNKRVLLVGGKLFFGHLGVMLNIRTNNTIADLIPYAAQMDEDLVNDVVTRHSSGIHVLVDPFDLQVAQGIRPEDLYNVLYGLQRMFDVLVVDVGSTLNENAVTLMDMADRIIVVTTPDLASIRDTSRFTQLTKTLAYPSNKLFFVINRTDMPGGVKTKDITPVMIQEFFSIPEGGPDVLRSINRGIPLVVKYPRNPTSRAVQQMADRFVKLFGSEFASIPVDGMVS